MAYMHLEDLNCLYPHGKLWNAVSSITILKDVVK